MEIVVALVVVAALLAAVLRVIRSDGTGRTPPVHSHSGWGSNALPSRAYSDLTAEGV